MGRTAANVIDMRAFAMRKAESNIWRARYDPSLMKALIMEAFRHRWLSATECESWIVLRGLEAA